MPAETPPGYPFPADQDLDQTIAYRTPRPARYDDPHTQRLPQWQQPEELGYGTAPAATPARDGRGWIVAIIAAVLVGVVGGGGVWAVAKLSGGGTQPQEVLPGNAIAYVRLDLDPAANQKVALFNIARKFSATKDSFSGDDPRKAVFETLKNDVSDFSKIDYATDIEPWLGDRIGVAVLAPAKSGDWGVAVAVQVKDQAAARAGIAKLGTGEKKTGLAFREDYAILAETQAEADQYAKAAPLADNAKFSEDLAALGEPGVLSFWADLGKVATASGADQNADAALLEPIRDARFAGALRFDGDFAELTGITRGGRATGTTEPQPVKIGELPASTVGAVSFSGLGDVLAKQWPQIRKAAESSADGQSFTRFLDQAQQSYGLALPDDLVTLLGKSLTVAIDERGLDGDQPNVGAVLSTDPGKAQEVLGKLEKFLADSGTPLQLAKAPGDGRLVVASSQEYAATLAKGGTLGDSETFKLAVPNADAATYAFYADIDKIEKLYLGGLQGEEKANAQVLRAIGLSGTYSGTDSGFTLRVAFN